MTDVSKSPEVAYFGKVGQYVVLNTVGEKGVLFLVAQILERRTAIDLSILRAEARAKRKSRRQRK